GSRQRPFAVATVAQVCHARIERMLLHRVSSLRGPLGAEAWLQSRAPHVTLRTLDRDRGRAWGRPPGHGSTFLPSLRDLLRRSAVPASTSSRTAKLCSN